MVKKHFVSVKPPRPGTEPRKAAVLTTTLGPPHPIKGRTVVDIGKPVVKHSEIVEGILQAHALSGCDTVASYFGIGNATVLKTLRSGYSLNLLGATGHSMGFVIQQATSFISACYGEANCSTMSQTRLNVWLSKTGKRSSTPKLCTLPPTTEAFKDNVKRAQHQTLVWQSLEAQNPPELDSTEYGWVKDEQNKSLNQSPSLVNSN